MEYFWYIVAALGAGVGTGLAGLSAATVMVPILIVLCPSFGGEYGAYQATAIALCSDILGSAVTAATYAKHKRLDLKHGWILMACIVSLCTVGSYLAYLAGNVVLGGFTLLLTFGIGIRFLVKPDTSRPDASGANVHLGPRQIAISLFYGVMIGLGTGFVGTGGGMMMLVVFTAFLGYELKTAVGTSTFIMTFTALIGFISHTAIHPAIVLQRWNVLIVCILAATAASLLSARFANRFSNRTVGLTTGVILTLLGGCMIYLQYLRALSLPTTLVEMGYTALSLLVFLAVALSLLLLGIQFLHIRGEVRRKLLHTIAFCLVLILILCGQSWTASALLSLLFAIIVYPILGLFEAHPLYSSLLQERRAGEIRKSLLLLFGTAAGLMALFWGLFRAREVLVAAILAWGVGDEAAALVGKRWGRHHLKLPHADPNKTVEGSLAMLLGAGGALFFVCTLYHFSPLLTILSVVLGAAVAAASEAVSKNGWDTVIVPCATALVLWLVSLWGVVL